MVNGVWGKQKRILEETTANDKSLYNMFVYFLTEATDQKDLHEFLEEQEQLMSNKGYVNFDLNFALNLFERKNCLVGKVYILSMMGIYEEAVLTAIKSKEYELARKKAQIPESAEKQKKLLLPIVYSMLENRVPISEIIEFMKTAREETPDVLKIDDFLNMFDDDADIRTFKDELAETLHSYNEDVILFKEEMEQNSKATDEVRADYFKLCAQKHVLQPDSFCEECYRSILTSEFIQFPCSHCYHRVISHLTRRMQFTRDEWIGFSELLIVSETKILERPKRQSPDGEATARNDEMGLQDQPRRELLHHNQHKREKSKQKERVA